MIYFTSINGRLYSDANPRPLVFAQGFCLRYMCIAISQVQGDPPHAGTFDGANLVFQRTGTCEWELVSADDPILIASLVLDANCEFILTVISDSESIVSNSFSYEGMEENYDINWKVSYLTGGAGFEAFLLQTDDLENCT